MPTESLPSGVVVTMPASAVYALPPGPHRVLTSTASLSYATAVGGPFNAIAANSEPGLLYETGFIRNDAGGPRFIIAKKITRLDTYAGQVAQANPANFWRLNEASGNTGLDYMGVSGFNLTKGSGVTQGAAGPTGDGSTAATFDGTANGDYTSGVIAPGYSTAISFEAWVWNSAWSATHEAVISFGAIGIYMSIENGFPFMSIHVGSQFTNRQVTPAALSVNEWHHVAATWETGDLLRLYSDGKEATSYSNGVVRSGTLTATTGLTIGTFDGTVLPYSGRLADVSWYRRKLTAAEIMQHYIARNNK